MKLTEVQEIRALCDEIIEHAARVWRDTPDLYDRLRYLPRDGFPTASMGEEGRGIGTHGDRTAQVAMTRPMADPVREGYRAMGRALLEAVRAMRTANGAIHTCGTQPKPKREPTIATCQRCGRSVARTTVDPLVKGFCESCYTAFNRWTKEGNRTDDPEGDRKRFIFHSNATQGRRVSEDRRAV